MTRFRATFFTMFCIWEMMISAFAQGETNAEILLPYLNPLLEESEKAQSTNGFGSKILAETELEIATAELDAAMASDAPNIVLESSTGPDKNWQHLKNRGYKAENPGHWNTSGSLVLRKNLYQGGVKDIRMSAQENRIEGARVSTKRSRVLLLGSMALDLLNISLLNAKVTENQESLERAKFLEDIAVRKQKVGSLGIRELLETKKDAYRSLKDLQEATLNFEDTLKLFDRTYHLNNYALANNATHQLFAALEKNILESSIKVLDKTVTHEAGNALVQSRSEIQNEIVQTNLDLKAKNLNLAASNLELQVSRRTKGYPKIDVSAGVNYLIPRNLPSGDSSIVPSIDSNLGIFSKISLTWDLYSPQSAAQINSEILTIKKQKLQLQMNSENLQNSSLDQLERLAAVSQKLETQKRLIELSEDLRDKNVRLFQAGEIDVLTVINSQQEISRLKIAFLDVVYQQKSIGMTIEIGRQLGLFLPTESNQAQGTSR